jgi:FemAB family protein
MVKYIQHLFYFKMQNFSNLKLKYIKRVLNKKIWDEYIKKISYVKVEFTNEFLDYQIEYMKSHNNIVTDHSYLIISNKKIIGIIINIISKKNKDISDNFTYIPIISITNNNDIKKALNDFDEILKQLFDKNEINLKFYSFNNVINNHWLKKIYFESLKKHDEINILLNLENSFENIFSTFNKSTKWRINQGKRYWRSKIIDADDEKSWLEFKNLHFREAKKLTRSEESWNIQYKNLLSKKAFLINLYNKENIIVGGGYFLLSKDEALYGVAAYDHDYFPKPIGHFLQYEAIKYIKSKNIKIYRLGSIFLKKENDKKLQSINEFKLSFSSYLRLDFSFEYKA